MFTLHNFTENCRLYLRRFFNLISKVTINILSISIRWVALQYLGLTRHPPASVTHLLICLTSDRFYLVDNVAERCLSYVGWC